MKTKLAIFLPDLNGGGAERVMLTLAKGFLERGIQVDLVLIRAAGPLLDLVPPGVRLYGLSNRIHFPSSKIGLGFSALWGLTRYLRRERPTTLMSTLTGANIIAVLAKILARSFTRLVLREANTALNCRSLLLQLAVRILYPQADAVIAVSRGVREDLINGAGLLPEKVTHIPNPVDIAAITRQADEGISHPWFCQGQPPVIIGLGRLTRQKDFATLICAFARLRQKRVARLMILGEGAERSKLEALVSRLDLASDVALPGFKANPYPYLRQATLFALSSRWEGMPSVILEALTLGVPVVATDCHSGPREILAGGRFGRIVPVGHTQALFRAMSDVLDQTIETIALQTRARHFLPDIIASRYLAVMVPPQAGVEA